MTALAEGGTLLGRWRDLTLAETAAIESDAWDSLAAIQAKKTHLQLEIDSWCSSYPSAAPALWPQVEELLGLEGANCELLRRRMETVGEERIALDQRSRVLRRIHRSYCGALGPAWQSYS